MRLHQQILDFDCGFCHVMVIPVRPPVIIATQMQESSGPSISNACETLAATIQAQFLASGDEFRLLLRYLDTSLPDRISEVTFDRRHGLAGHWEFAGPDWQPVDEGELRALLNGHLPGDLLELTGLEAGRLAGIRERRRRESEAWSAAERASFEVTRLDCLPPTGDDIEPAAPGADWATVANAATAILSEGLDPLDGFATQHAVAACGLPALETSLLASLYRDPIVVTPGDNWFSNGRHRTAAMRQAGVRACVINTRAGHHRETP